MNVLNLNVYIIHTIYSLFNLICKYVCIRNKGVILMYHNINDIKNEIEDSCNCYKYDFFNQVDYFIKKGYTFISIDNYFDFIKSSSQIKFAILTFDDVSENVYYNAYPYLKKRQIPFVLYLAYNWINRPEMLKEWQIKEMIDSGICIIGAHTLNHAMLQNNVDIESEIIESKNKIEKLFNIQVNHFAYPFGQPYQVCIKAINLTSKYYKTAVSTMPLNVNILTQRVTYFLPRIVPNKNYKLSI